MVSGTLFNFHDSLTFALLTSSPLFFLILFESLYDIKDDDDIDGDDGAQRWPENVPGCSQIRILILNEVFDPKEGQEREGEHEEAVEEQSGERARPTFVVRLARPKLEEAFLLLLAGKRRRYRIWQRHDLQREKKRMENV